MSSFGCEWVSDENRGFTSRALPYEEARAASGGQWQIRDFIISIFGSASRVRRKGQTGPLGLGGCEEDTNIVREYIWICVLDYSSSNSKVRFRDLSGLSPLVKIY